VSLGREHQVILASNAPWRVQGKQMFHGEPKASRWRGGTENQGSGEANFAMASNISRGKLKRPKLLNADVAETH